MSSNEAPGARPDRDTRSHDNAPTTDRGEHRGGRDVDRTSVLAHEREEHGGIKIGSAFFGWLTATGMVVVLTALASAVGAAVGAAAGTAPDAAADQAAQSLGTVSVIGGVLLLAILFLAYYCGGYVAGRMARFDGLKQGLAVWLWALLVAVVVAVLATVAGGQFDVLSQLNSFPRIPASSSDLTTGGLIALAIVVLASLAGSLLGGLAGMRFHRKVDRTGLGA